MATDLVLRLCQVDEDEGGFPPDQHIAINDFVSGLWDIFGDRVAGVASPYHTVTQMKTFYNMPTNQQNQLDALIAKIASAPTDLGVVGRLRRFESILHKWERKQDLNLTGYDTPDDIETQLLAIDGS